MTKISTEQDGSGGAARPGGHGVPKPNPFPKSIYDNVAYGAKLHGLASRRIEFDEIVETSLRKAGLWEEVKDRLPQPGTGLSGASSSACASPAPSPSIRR